MKSASSVAKIIHTNMIRFTLIQPKKLVSPFIQFTRYLVLSLFYLPIKKIEGRENLPKSGPFLIASNHINRLDAYFLAPAIVLYTSRMVYFIAKIQPWGFFWEKVLSDLWAGCIPYDKNNKSKCLEMALQRLQKGEIVGFFPEGRSNKNNTLLKGKTGCARLALWAKVPVIPVGFYDRPEEKRRAIIFNAFFKPKHIKIKIGRPLYFYEYYNKKIFKELLDEITKKIMLEISQLCGKPYPY